MKNKLSLLPVLCAMAAAVSAQQTPALSATTPAIIDFAHCFKPEWPQLVGDVEMQTAATLAYQVGVDGKLLAARLLQSSGSTAFDQAALAAGRACRFQPAAVNGKPVAAWLQFRYVHTPTDLVSDPALVREYLQARSVAEQGGAAAQLLLARLLEQGRGVAPNPDDALRWYRQAAQSGSAEAQLWLGNCYFNGVLLPKDKVEALRWYQAAADDGNAQAQNALGLMYQRGDGVPKDFDEAARMYLLAALQGYDVAQNNLGYMYWRGQGLEQNPAIAVDWYRKAATQGNAWAQQNLSVAYERGLGVAADRKQARHWLERAAAQGFTRAQVRLGDMLMEYVQSEADRELAVYWYRRAAEQGDLAGQISLAYCYETGHGVTQDFAQAAAWYSRAVGQTSSLTRSAPRIPGEDGRGIAGGPAQTAKRNTPGGVLQNVDSLRMLALAQYAESRGEQDAVAALGDYSRLSEVGELPIVERHIRSYQLPEVPQPRAPQPEQRWLEQVPAVASGRYGACI
ncbi:TonB family protein [Massilia sp. erpn]|uniref:TonB family protein n=1 Tax=Massilia sp. erpn TaxID=2738142 RepID=UPI002103042F|nr:TonB family protein [Massilia sp. erpn]UTY59997.1 TonB family protein [Massilia sp. erpn]